MTQSRAVNPYRDNAPAAGPLRIRLPVPRANATFGVFFALIPTLSMVGFVRSGAPPLAIAMPLLFIAVGIGVALGRRGAVVDREAGTLTTWWGLWFPIGRKSKALGGVSHVSVGTEVRGTGKNRVTVYPVRIESDAGEVVAPRQYEVARRTAEKTANYLGTGLHDSTSGALVIREAGTLDEPLRDRLARQGTLPPSPGPAPARFAVHPEGDETACVLPPAGLSLVHFVGLAGSLFFSGFVAYHFLFAGNPPKLIMLAASLMCLLPFFWTVPSFLDALFGRETVLFSDRGVALKPWGWLRRTIRIPSDKLEELVVVSHASVLPWSGSATTSVLARGDEVTLCLGASLTQEEAAWLHAAISDAIGNSMFGRSGA